MKVPLSWLQEFVDIDIPIDDLAYRLTMAGLEVEEVTYIGLPLPTENREGDPGKPAHLETKLSGLWWDPAKIVVACVSEVMLHPNADRLVLCKLFDGISQHIVLTGAPNLFPYKGIGPLAASLKVAYAREGARIYDGHQPGQVATTLKRAKIRGVDSYSMICSEKELGISDEHEGVILLDQDAPIGVALVDYMGDAVLNISILPNIARAASVLGVAREVAALTGKVLRQPDYSFISEGPAIQGAVSIVIRDPELNPRFVLGLIGDVKINPSSYKIQRRLRLSGMRPINNIVDATNYTMLEIGEPLHAFDYDVLVQRAGGNPPTIITRAAEPGEHLTTLDGVDRSLEASTVLVCDTIGALSIAGVMGGAESEVSEKTRTVLLEGAAWSYTNIRKTARSQNLPSEASFRFSRGVHPAMAERGVRRCLEMLRQTTGGTIAEGLIDKYPNVPITPTVEITQNDVKRWLGIEIRVDEIRKILESLEFSSEIIETQSDASLPLIIRATAPDHRLDIGEGIIGKSDLIEEIARIYGYDRIPESRLAEELPPPRSNPALEFEEHVRDLLAYLGLQEVMSHRLTAPEREARRFPPAAPADDKPYIRLANPITNDRVVLRHSILAGLLEVFERNSRLREHIALFEIGPIFIESEGSILPDELPRLAILMAGIRDLPGWQKSDLNPMDFYDLKGLISALLDGLHIPEVRYEPVDHPTFHPGKCARIIVVNEHGLCDKQLGVFGEIHPLVRNRYELPASYANTPLLAADLDLEILQKLTRTLYHAQLVHEFPPVLEDLALVVDETIPAERVTECIRAAGGKTISAVRLFDVYRSDIIGAGKKSLAYRLTYQATDRTLSDKEVTPIRLRIVRTLEREVGAILRS